MTAVVGIAGVWLAHALVLSIVMARRGHDAFQWALLGVFLGPIAIPLAFAHRERVAVQVPAASAGRVLVAIRPHVDLACVVPALEHLHSLAGPVPVTLATVLDAEAAERPNRAAALAEAEAFLDRAGAALVEAGIAQSPFERRVLYGDPATALAEFASRSQAVLVVVGAGEPIARRVLRGSTRSRLMGHAPVPVLYAVGGRAR